MSGPIQCIDITLRREVQGCLDSISEDKATIQIQVLANDHFREEAETTYQFLISEELWLPLEVGKSTPIGVQDGRIIFRNLRININVPDSLFQ